ncbi:type VI secretion system tip protein VgrG, partial [Pseudomonas sp. MWU13-2860]
LTIAGDRRVRLSANDSLSVAGRCQLDVTGAWVVQGGEQIHLRSGADLILDDVAQLTLHVGGHHPVINGDGIFCSTLPLGGGSASSGQALMSVLPQRPGETVKELTERVLALTPLMSMESATPPVEKAVCEECLLRGKKQAEPFTPR